MKTDENQNLREVCTKSSELDAVMLYEIGHVVHTDADQDKEISTYLICRHIRLPPGGLPGQKPIPGNSTIRRSKRRRRQWRT